MPSAFPRSDMAPSVDSGTEDGPHNPPDLVHNLQHDSSVLALAVSEKHGYVFAGTQEGEILVWSLGTFEKVRQVQAHKRTVLGLFLSADESRLFSTAGDPIVNVWDPTNMHRLCEIYSTNDVGDIFSVVYSSQYDTVYFGAQDTTIQWVTLSDPSRISSHDSPQHPDRREHRFFDSKAIGGTSTPRRNDDRWALIPRADKTLEVYSGSILRFAHFGYVYCMLMARGPTVLVDVDQEVLISGGGDGTIKLWDLRQTPKHGSGSRSEEDDDEVPLHEIMVLGDDDSESVMSLVIDGSFLYAGKLSGVIELWDLDTKQRLRVIKSHKGDIMALQMGWGYLWSVASNGTASKHSTVHYGKYQNAHTQTVSQRYQCLSRWKAHDGKIISATLATHRNEKYFITGANDNQIAVWHIDEAACAEAEAAEESDDAMLTALREFVSYRTMSSRPEFAEDCRKGATFLCGLFKRLGGQVEMLSSDDHHNPVVYAKFSGKLEPAEKRKRILFYGHYDVVPADSKKGKWETDPFHLKGLNGYLYGRGVSDNKGPIVAALFAVTDLMQAKALENDVIFLIEGEEESGSRGFRETVHRNKDLIGHIDYILLANSYWLDDEVPCLTYGLRGVLHATLCVDSPHPDLHSGVDGSHMMDEALSDLTLLVSKLKGPRNRVLIPGFYDEVPPITPEEEARYDDIASILMRRNPENGPAKTLRASLMARWREPNLTIHRYKVSGPDGSLVSSHASVKISLRLVPGQEVEDVITNLKGYLDVEFQKLESVNRLTVSIDNKAEPWLGDPTNEIFRTLEKAVMQAWAPLFDAPVDEKKNGKLPATAGEAESDTNSTAGNGTTAGPLRPRRPLYIREGGSIPGIRFLEKEFGAPAAHLPCGQSSDSAHLDNERLRVLNLLKSREIFGMVFGRL